LLLDLRKAGVTAGRTTVLKRLLTLEAATLLTLEVARLLPL